MMAAGFRLSNKRMRDMERVVHLVGGLLLVLHVYAPWVNGPDLMSLVRFVVVPVLVGSGLAMWQLPRMRARLTRRKMAMRTVRQGGQPSV